MKRLTTSDWEIIGAALGYYLAGPIEADTDEEAERIRDRAESAHRKVTERIREGKRIVEVLT